MAAEQDLRLAWWAQRVGRSGTRDVLLTLAAAASVPDDAWASRCRLRLIATRPDHWFAPYPTLSLALDDSGVVAAMSRLRASFPPARVDNLLLRYEALAGPHLGRLVPMSVVLDDLIGPGILVATGRRKRRQPARVPSEARWPAGCEPATNSAPSLPLFTPEPEARSIWTSFLAVWLAGSVLLPWPPAVEVESVRAA